MLSSCLKTIFKPKFSFGRTLSTQTEFLNSILQKNGIINNKAKIYYNLTYDEIRKHELENNEVEVADVDGKKVHTVSTGIFTGRSPNDKYFVKQQPSENNINWNNVNKAISLDVFNNVYEQVKNHFSNDAKKIYIFDGYCGYLNGGKYAKKVRFITEYAWQHHFVTNMFVRPSKEELKNDKNEPDFTIINGCNIQNKNWKEQKLNSETFIGFNIEEKRAVITNSHYGGELKKGMFTLMNYWYPLEGKLTIHSSACNYVKNNNSEKKSAMFLSLSGGGKTTHISTADFTIIGDDETIWDEQGLGNIEGGCYPKLEKLNPEKEPVIYGALNEYALMENVILKNGKPDFYDLSKTNNTRVSYPIFNMKNYEKTGRGTHPERIIYLACDYYGILPRVSILDNEQAMKYYLCGYTSNMPGTVRGENTIKPTFSCAFGNAFLPLKPSIYGNLMKEKIKKHGSKVYLVSTGLVGDPQDPKTERVPLETTRKIIKSIIEGDIDQAPTTKLTTLDNLEVPLKIRDLDEKTLIPWNSWKSQERYHEESKKLMKMFDDEYKKYV